tara:strand:- start:2106 stop:3419 length:1314 start_codon:yes stop_codon:yes gene_type:complete
MFNISLDALSKLRLFKNIKYEALQIFISLLIQLVFPLTMIGIFGVYNFGIFIFIITILNLLDIFKFNMSSFGIQKMSYLFNVKKISETKKILKNCSSIIIINSIFIILIFFLIFFKIYFLENILSEINEFDKNLIFIFIAINFSLNTLIQLFEIGISYKGELFIHYNLTTLKFLSTRLLIILVSFFTKDFLNIFYMYTLINFIFFFYYSYHFKKNFKFNVLFPSVKCFSFFKKNVKQILSFSNEKTSDNIKDNLQLFFVGILFHPEIIALLATAKTLFYFLPLRVLRIFINNFNYEYLKLFTKNKIKNIKINYINQLFYMSSFTIAVVFFGALLGKDIYTIWLKDNIQITNFLINLILLDVSLTLIYQTSSTYLKSINNFFYISLTRILFEILIILIFFMGHYLYNYSYENLFILNIFFMVIMSVISFSQTLKEINK